MPYGSARDLPKFREMQRQLKEMRRLRFLIPKEQRPQLENLSAELDHLADTVDSFYALLGPRNWIFHDDLNADAMADLARVHSDDPEAAEQVLIAWYQADDCLPNLVRRLHWHEALRARMPLLQFALDDFHSGRYYAVVQTLLSVMDGFVNDLDPANRKGLHAREPDELEGWNSVVGHHLGLSHAHKSFTKRVNARNDDPIYELHRNGIAHGMLTNYNNVVVATKAWNRLFAVADWAKAVELEQQEAAKPAEPPLRELLARVKANAEAKVALEEFTPVTLTTEDSGLVSHPVYGACTHFLNAWRENNNYGRMAEVITSTAGKVAPIDVRNDYQGSALTEFRITAIDQQAAAVCIVTTELMIDGVPRTPELRWVREGPDGQIAPPNEPGAEWRLLWWGYPHMIRDGN